jgi:hypothetical protein
MNRLELKLRYRKLAVTGDELVRAEIELALKTGTGKWTRATFRVDPGTEMTSISAGRARRLGLPMPIQPTLGIAHGQAKLEIRSGLIRARVIGMDATEYVFPCFFLGDPNIIPGSSSPAFLHHHLLGLTRVVDKLRVILEDPRDPAFPHGKLIVEKI